MLQMHVQRLQVCNHMCASSWRVQHARWKTRELAKFSFRLGEAERVELKL
jgi:hypothetical protein